MYTCSLLSSIRYNQTQVTRSRSGDTNLGVIYYEETKLRRARNLKQGGLLNIIKFLLVLKENDVLHTGYI